MFKIKDRSRVELLVKLENILSQKRWDLSDDLLMPLFNKFLLVYNGQEPRETSPRLQRSSSTDLDIISLQSNVEQYAVEKELLLQEMVRCVTSEEAYLALLHKLFNLERQILRELYQHDEPNYTIVV